MKKFILLVSLLSPVLLIGQDTITTENEGIIFDTGGETMPQFPGGEQAMYQFLITNIKYPTIAKDNGIYGKVYIQFVVDITGEIKDVKVIKGVSPELDAEAKRVIEMMPNWKPGTANGEPIKVGYTIPVTFSLK